MSGASDFDKYAISTQTLIISTNIIIDCQKFFDQLQIVPIKKPANTRTRMTVCEEDQIGVADGSVVFAQYKNDSKGTSFKKLSEKYFLNSVTIIMKIGIKYVNIKVSNKGKLQITGCNQQTCSSELLDNLWSLVRHMQCWVFQSDQSTFKATIVPVMCNINFSIGFNINRELLNMIINTKTKYISILEPSDGYVGVNIKISTDDEPLEQIKIDQYEFNNHNKTWSVTKVNFIDYIKTLTLKEQKKKIAKCYVNTFLVFYSGKVIMSGGISYLNRKKSYESFMNIVQEHRHEIAN
jgi:TATA-box binding protein (TBP) (component of TFIID and TFIIIB)